MEKPKILRNEKGLFEKGHSFIAGGEKGWFKKGQHESPKTEFKKGQTTWNKNIQGEQSHCWEGGSSTWEGYQARRALEKHYGMKWEQMCLPNKPCIHHIDHNRRNNAINNLCVMVRSEHQSSHVRGII